MKRMWHAVKAIWEGHIGAENRKYMTRNFIILGCLGVMLMLLSNYFKAGTKETETAPVLAIESQKVDKSTNEEQQLEQRLQTMLEQLPGVGRVHVMIVFDASKQVVIQQNVENNQQVTEEQDRNGATRQIREQSKQSQAVMQQSSGNQQPLVVQTIQPKVRGVLIVAEGAERPVIKQMILEAVRKGLHVRLSAISILPSDSIVE